MRRHTDGIAPRNGQEWDYVRHPDDHCDEQCEVACSAQSRHTYVKITDYYRIGNSSDEIR